jgi:nucleoside-diphosphate-sugar epimerase
VAVIGANGFIGNRLVEMLTLAGRPAVPIVRRPSALALPARFDLDGRVADARDEDAMAAALAGCEVAVSAITGDAATIVGSVGPTYRAAHRAGVRRLVHLSSASVHGQSPPVGTDERSPLSDRQPVAYNNAKVRAERELLTCRAGGSTEVAILRPGIVYGPRSQWIGGLADEVLAGTAVLVEGGRGVCNTVYVDDVVRAVLAAADAEAVDGEAFLIGDDAPVTWRDLAEPVCRALGVDVDELPRPPASAAVAPRPWRDRAARFYGLRHRLPAPVRAGLRAARQAARDRAGEGAPAPTSTAAVVTVETALLHTCRWQLPSAKAHAGLGWRPSVPFTDGCQRSIAWLAFAGYPVVPAR